MNKHSQARSSNHIQAVPHAVELGSRAIEVVSETADQLKKAASSTERFMKQYPKASAGAFLGAGVLFGAFVHRVFGHTPTIAETLGLTALPARARRSIKEWL
jgi:hypothetical protein